MERLTAEKGSALEEHGAMLEQARASHLPASPRVPTFICSHLRQPVLRFGAVVHTLVHTLDEQARSMADELDAVRASHTQLAEQKLVRTTHRHLPTAPPHCTPLATDRPYSY